MFYHYDLGLDPWAFGSFGNDRVTIDEDGSVVFTGFGRDTVRVRADEVTVDLGFGRDVVRTYGDDIVVNGRFGRDRLLGGDGADSLWGNFREDVIRTGKGADYALGNQGNDLTDTGERLGIHFGGAGNDTFFIGQEIVGNGARDTVIALDFGNGRDRLDIAPEILANVARVEEGKVDLVPVLAAFEAEGLGVPEVGQRLSQTFLGDLAFREVPRAVSAERAGTYGARPVRFVCRLLTLTLRPEWGGSAAARCVTCPAADPTGDRHRPIAQPISARWVYQTRQDVSLICHVAM